jgi:hypothetical protein
MSKNHIYKYSYCGINSAPTDGKYILIKCHDFPVPYIAKYESPIASGKAWGWITVDGYRLSKVVSWCPLPL